jgi:hypothetical protein
MHATVEAQKHVTSISQTSSPLRTLRAFRRHNPRRQWQQRCRASLKDDLAEVSIFARVPCVSPIRSSKINAMLPPCQMVVQCCACCLAAAAKSQHSLHAQVQGKMREREAAMQRAASAEDYKSAVTERDALNMLKLQQRRVELELDKEARIILYEIGRCIVPDDFMLTVLYRVPVLTSSDHLPKLQQQYAPIVT